MRKRKKGRIVVGIVLGMAVLLVVFFIVMNEGPLVLWSSREPFPRDSQFSDILAKAFGSLEKWPAFSPYYMTITVEGMEMAHRPTVEVGAAKYMGIDEQYLLYATLYKDGQFIKTVSIGEARSLNDISNAVMNDDVHFKANVEQCVAYFNDFMDKPDEPWQDLQVTYNWDRIFLTYTNQSGKMVVKGINLSQ